MFIYKTMLKFKKNIFLKTIITAKKFLNKKNLYNDINNSDIYAKIKYN